jgi:two-component system, response regulator PdtaR
MPRVATIACAAEAGGEVNPGVELPVILVVEDDVLIRLATAEYLRARNLLVIEAVSADEAIAVLAAGERVDLVFTDVHLPTGMDGFGLARWIEAHCPRVAVLLTSGVAPLAAARIAVAEDVVFIQKPYNLLDVEAHIIRLLGQRRPENGNGQR